MLENIIKEEKEFEGVVVGKGKLHILQYSQYITGLMDKPQYDGALFYIKPFSYEIIKFMVEYYELER